MKKILIAIIFTLSISLSAFAQNTAGINNPAGKVNKLFDMTAAPPAEIPALHTPELQTVPIQRRVVRQTLISESLPKLKIKVDSSLKYLGRVEMDAMNGIAKVEQFFFGKVKQGKLGKMLIVHFEHALPTNDFKFGYPRLRMVTLGSHEFLNQTWAIKDYALLKREKVKEFLDKNGLQTEPDWLVNRYVRVVDENKKHELILFYMEPASSFSIPKDLIFPIEDLASEGKHKDEWQKITQALISSSIKSFKILED